MSDAPVLDAPAAVRIDRRVRSGTATVHMIGHVQIGTCGCGATVCQGVHEVRHSIMCSTCRADRVHRLMESRNRG